MGQADLFEDGMPAPERKTKWVQSVCIAELCKWQGDGIPKDKKMLS